MSESYGEWCEKVKHLSPADMSGIPLNSENTIRRVVLDDGLPAILKIISPQRPYVPRIKALGEVAYALLDYHLDSDRRVTPNVYAQSPDVIWRSWIKGRTGENWRGDLYEHFTDLERADREIVSFIEDSPSAERIALLDFIFLCQDRSGNNWLKDSEGHFWAIDNAMFWTYRGRFADKRAIRTGRVHHLKPPFEALVSQGGFKFRNGVFSSLYAGHNLSGGLYQRLEAIDWNAYFYTLSNLAAPPLMYPYEIVNDWRFTQLQRRAAWILDKKRFPKMDDLWGAWQLLVDMPPDGIEIWDRQWEIRLLEKL